MLRIKFPLFFDNFWANHQAEASHMSDGRQSHFFEPVTKIFSERLHAFPEAILHVKFDGSECGGTAYRISKKGTGMQRFAGRSRPGIHHRRPPDAGSRGKSRRQSLSKTEKVRKHAELITGKKCAGSIEPSVDFIENEQDLVSVTNLSEHTQKVERGHHFAAAPLAGLDDNASNRALPNGLDDLVLDRRQTGACAIRKPGAVQSVAFQSSERTSITIWIGNRSGKVAQLLLKRLAKPLNADHLQGSVSQPVISAGEPDDPWLSAVQHGGFDRDFDCLKTGIAQSCFPDTQTPPLECDLAQLLAKKELIFGGMDISHGVHQFGGLIDHRRPNRWVGMAVGRHRETGGKIQKAVSVDIPDIRSGSLFPKYWKVRREIGDIAIFVLRERGCEIARARTWDRSNDFWEHRKPSTCIAQKSLETGELCRLCLAG